MRVSTGIRSPQRAPLLQVAKSASATIAAWLIAGALIPGPPPVFAAIAQECAAKGGYRVKTETVPFDAALNNYRTAAQGGQGPDVFRAEVAWVPLEELESRLAYADERRLIRRATELLADSA